MLHLSDNLIITLKRPSLSSTSNCALISKFKKQIKAAIFASTDFGKEKVLAKEKGRQEAAFLCCPCVNKCVYKMNKEVCTFIVDSGDDIPS